MKRHLLLCLLLCLFCTLRGNIYFKHLGKADGLSQISVVSICQDELGRMWFGTLEGLSCYDGTSMTVYKPSQANTETFLGNEIHNIVSDKRGNLFFTSDRVLIRYNLAKERFSPQLQDASCIHAQNEKVWVAAHDSIYAWDREQEKFTFIYKLQKSITSLYIDANNCFWLGTPAGLYRIDNIDNPAPICVIPNVSIHSLYQDTKGRMWVAAYRAGMYKIENGISQKFAIERDFELSSNDVRCFVEDPEGSIWIGTFNGLNKIDTAGRISYYKKDKLPGSLKHPSIFSLYKDQQGTIWVGTYYAGVHYFNPKVDIFRYYSEDADRDDCLSFSFVGNMVEDKRGDVWICTEGGGLNYLNRKTGRFIHYLTHETSGSQPFYNLKCIEYDESQDCLYIGTHKQGFLRFDIPTQKTTHYTDSHIGHSFSDMTINGDSLYLFSERGIFVKKKRDNLISRLYPSIPEIAKGGSSFLIDAKHYLWVALRDRVVRINMKNPKEKHIYKYGEKGLGRFQVLKLAEDKEGTIFLGTSGAGLYKFSSKDNLFKQCNTADIRYCYNILITPQGYLAISNERGLLLYQPQTEEMRIVNDRSQFDGCGLLLCRNGEIFVGGTESMTSFMSSALFNDSSPYNLYFSSLTVNDKLVTSATSNHILKTALPFAAQIELEYDENNLAISFTSNSYIENSNKSIYEYRLEGFGKEWSTTYGNTIVYTNLDPGTYKLVVREKQLNSQTEARAIELPIIVHSPWWATWLAYLVYACIVLTIVYVLLNNWRTKVLLQSSLAQEKLEKEKNEELTQAKLQFFANISHEFRTPLTLIISQIESLLQSGKLSPFLRTRLQMINKNTFQFRELISELLDFRKMDRGKLNLYVWQMDIIPYLRQIYDDFKNQAVLQNVQFEFRTEAENLMVWYDARQLRKVFSNLLTNAFKHTPEKGKVELVIEEKETTIEIKVIDNGEGISEEDLPFIFERFYQVDSAVSSPGSGIGLALSKGVVELHHGEIKVKSALHYGSIFTVVLPKENLFGDDTRVTFTEPGSSHPPYSTAEIAAETEEAIGNDEEQAPESQESVTERDCVLLVEDNEELLQIVTSLLSPLYRVVIAMDGKTGLDKALEERPDLILSDIMMPVMNGIEMCTKIKSHFDLCHIPVLLLTALTSDSKKMEGLQCGADDYIEKPFNNKMLLGRIANIIRNRKLLKQKYGEGIAANMSVETDVQALALTPIDTKFLTKLEEVVKEHLADTEFDVNTLASELALSRSSLYNKLKALSCMTPNEYILNARLRYSSELLKNNPELQITEIAYRTGFNSLRYYRHCFKACFNQTPQEYRAKKG